MTHLRPVPYPRIAIWSFVLIPLIVVGATETIKSYLIWRIRIVDYMDLVFMAPFLLVMLLYFNHQVYYKKKERELYFISLGMLAVTMYGHAMHLTGNTINTYSTEIHQYLDQIPPDTYELIYFFDEDLGHWLLYTGLIGSLGLWMIADQRYQPASWQDYAAGGLLGVCYAIAIIESSQAFIGFAAAVWLIACALYRSRSVHKNGLLTGLYQELSQSLWYRLGITTAIMLVAGEIVYFVAFGSFIQPSQLGF